MDRPRHRRVRSLLAVAGGATLTFVALGIPASAAATVTGRITAGRSGLSVRTGPTTLATRTETLRTGTRVTIECQVTGQRIAGRVRTTDRWDRLPNGRFISDAYVDRPAGLQPCPAGDVVSAQQQAPAAVPAGTWVNPVAPHRAPPGFRTAQRPRHDGVDFVVGRNTPIHAAAAGTVVTVRCNTSGPSCDVDGSPAVSGCGWYAEIRHDGDIVTRYCHMARRPAVAVGEQVQAGQVIGFVGSSGNSSCPHLHLEVHRGSPAARANAVDPIAFMDSVHVTIS